MALANGHPPEAIDSMNIKDLERMAIVTATQQTPLFGGDQ